VKLGLKKSSRPLHSTPRSPIPLPNPAAARSVAVMIYVGAIVGEGDTEPENVWIRPQTLYSMSNEALARTRDADRLAWAAAAARSVKSVAALLQGWGLEHHQWYAADTREGPRDETWPKWKNYGAARERLGISTSSPAPRWAIAASFADLFNPALKRTALASAIEDWRETHMDPGEVLKLQRDNEIATSKHQVTVHLPEGGVRQLEPGPASLIIKGVIEEWAPRRLGVPFVVAISEPGTKVYILDAAKMAIARISINVSNVLPDVILLDAGTKPPTFWIVEVAYSDGVVSKDRKTELLTWAQDQYIKPEHCQFLSALDSRNGSTARKRLKDIAVDTYCWFYDEPNAELAWNELPEQP
jgi:BsuBI/PstI restriction endonuclease domain/BsuBI/PstI restriction endonuclease HTH domain